MDVDPFGVLLQQYRRAAHLTQEALAEQAHVSVRALSDLERGTHRAPRQETIALLVKALRLSAAEREHLEMSVSRLRRPAQTPPLEKRDGRVRHPSPPVLTPLLGREYEEDMVIQLLQQNDTRLLTLMGPAGVGKTRLAMQVAQTAQEHFPGGVSFIELAAVRDSALLIPTIAQQLGVQERGATLLEETLALAIGDRKMLLVLDNLEQILPAAISISRLLAHCPHLKTLITSRAALQVRGEHRFPLAPLAFPDPDSRSDWAEAISYPAVALICQRAQAISPDFALQTQEDAHVVAQLCRCLDGLPLAIELAAARLNIFSLQGMLARLTSAQNTSPLDVLSGNIQDLPARQQSARTAIQWSYDLLDAEEQQVFHAMCLFESSASLAALRAVTMCDEEALLRVLASLIDKSLIFRDERDSETLRFGCLALLRAYGIERVEALGEARPLWERFAASYLLLAEEAERCFASHEQVSWLRTLDHELPHLRTALRWCLEHSQIEQGLCLVAALRRYWSLRGLFSEGRHWAKGFLSYASDDTLAHARARAFLCNGALAFRQGAYAESKTLCEQGLALMRSLQDEQGIALALCLTGRASMDQGYYQDAEPLLQQSLERFISVSDISGRAFALSILGATYRYQEKWTEAIACYEEALMLERQQGDLEHIARGLNNLAAAVKELGDFRQAQVMYTEALALAEQIGAQESIATVTSNLGHTSYEQSNYARAVEYHRTSLKMRRELGDIDGVAFSLCNLGHAEQQWGDAQAARQHFLDALPLLL